MKATLELINPEFSSYAVLRAGQIPTWFRQSKGILWDIIQPERAREATNFPTVLMVHIS